jgi:hypothetical protein
MESSVELMLRDYVFDLADSLRRAKQDAEKNGTDFAVGRKTGLYEALSMLVNRASSFEITPASVGLDGIEPDKFL